MRALSATLIPIRGSAASWRWVASGSCCEAEFPSFAKVQVHLPGGGRAASTAAVGTGAWDVWVLHPHKACKGRESGSSTRKEPWETCGLVGRSGHLLYPARVFEVGFSW